MRIRNNRADKTREKRRQAREKKQAELAHEAYIREREACTRARLAKQITASIDELPPLKQTGLHEP